MSDPDDLYADYMNLMARKPEQFLAVTDAISFFEEAIQEIRPDLSYFIDERITHVRLQNDEQTLVVGAVPIFDLTPGELCIAVRNLAVLGLLGHIDLDDCNVPVA